MASDEHEVLQLNLAYQNIPFDPINMDHLLPRSTGIDLAALDSYSTRVQLVLIKGIARDPAAGGRATTEEGATAGGGAFAPSTAHAAEASHWPNRSEGGRVPVVIPRRSRDRGATVVQGQRSACGWGTWFQVATHNRR
jgi:hypothetical protein